MFRVDTVNFFPLSEVNILYCSYFILFHKLIQQSIQKLLKTCISLSFSKLTSYRKHEKIPPKMKPNSKHYSKLYTALTFISGQSVSL